MDPLFERRELTRNVHLDSRFLQRNIHTSLIAKLRHSYEGICLPEGFIQPRSITIAEHSLGRTDSIRGGINYNVRFQAEICLPHSGQVFRAPVVLKSKIGVHAETAPIKVLLPRDLHIGNPEFDNVEPGQDIEFDVVGSRFQQGDASIVVLGKLRQIIKPKIETEEATTETTDLTGIIAAAVGSPTTDKKTVTVDLEKTKPDGVRRTKKIRTVAPTTNEASGKGKVEGKS
jgi:DNA-directed RNA polymerase subunit E'/Rpb7